MNRPNILWYCTDQQRFDTIGALGNPHVVTPVIDALVAEKTERIADAVESGRLTQDEADEKLAEIEDRVTDKINGIRGERGDDAADDDGEISS